MSINAFSDPVYDAIRAYVEANWTYAPIQWPNEVWDEPPNEPWVKFEIFSANYGQQSIGAQDQEDNRWDHEGHIWFHVMVPRGSGATNARGAAKSLANLFRGERLLGDQNLEFMDAIIGPGAPGDEEGNWTRTSVSVEWRHWEA